MRKILFLFLIFCFTLSPISSFASPDQDPPPPSSGGPVGAPPPVGLPINMGLSALLISGLGLGIGFLRNNKK